MGSSSRRKFQRARERHWREVRRDAEERKQAKLKGFKPATKEEMAKTILSLGGGLKEPKP